MEKAKQEWSCHMCTFINPPSRKYCGMCSSPRQESSTSTTAAARETVVPPAKTEANEETKDQEASQTEQVLPLAPVLGLQSCADPTAYQVVVKKRKIPMELQRLFATMQVHAYPAIVA